MEEEEKDEEKEEEEEEESKEKENSNDNKMAQDNLTLNLQYSNSLQSQSSETFWTQKHQLCCGFSASFKSNDNSHWKQKNSGLFNYNNQERLHAGP